MVEQTLNPSVALYTGTKFQVLSALRVQGLGFSLGCRVFTPPPPPPPPTAWFTVGSEFRV